MNGTAVQIQQGRSVRGITFAFKDSANPLPQDDLDMFQRDFSSCVDRRGFRGGLRVDWSGIECVLLELAAVIQRPAYCIVLLGGRPSGVRLLEVSECLTQLWVRDFQPFDDDAPARDAFDDRYQMYLRGVQLTIDAGRPASEAWY